MALAAPIVRTDLRLDTLALVGEPAPNGCTILVIEDDPDVRRVVRRSLQADGYTVLEAEDGQSGLDLIERYAGRLDLVLTDLDMPGIDGITVAEVLAMLRPLLAVVCMSGGIGERELIERLGPAPGAFIAKPFTAESLAHVVADELARSQELSARAEAQQSVTRAFLVEKKLMVAVDLVASAQRLQSYHERRRHPRLTGSGPA